jgi:hypothetical protein
VLDLANTHDCAHRQSKNLLKKEANGLCEELGELVALNGLHRRKQLAKTKHVTERTIITRLAPAARTGKVLDAAAALSMPPLDE